MGNKSGKILKAYAALGAMMGWAIIVGQFYLSASNRIISFPELIFRFMGYFTITTNTFVALCFTFFWIPGKSRLSRWLRKPASVFSIAVFIVVVGIVYNLILRFLWQPVGLQLWIDELLHSVQPLLFLLFWILFMPKAHLKMKAFYPWLVYPLVYMVYVILLGAFTGHYPYPFADVDALGYPRVLLNGLGMMVGFLLLAWLLLMIPKGLKKLRMEDDIKTRALKEV
jgi:hypothetical protein